MQDRSKGEEMDLNLTPGLYEATGIAYLVRPTRDGQRLYAMRLTVTASGIESEYDKGIVHYLTPEDRMSRKRAVELMRICRRCLVCHRALEDEKSIERGMGPVCGKFLPE
jgi:hypothetical protein